MNWFDGIKGLSIGVSGIGFLTLGIFGLVRQEVAWEAGLGSFLLASFFLAGICGGAFLLFWRGKIILGDSGSQVLGFLLAVLSIFAGTKIATTLLVLGLPILDLFFVIVRRVFKEKVSPFRGDKKHLHHNLSRKIGESRTALLMIAISGISGVIAIFVTGYPKLIFLLLVVLLIFLLSEWSQKGLRSAS
jgi:UDP-GlcNAc:undecaprenyl-phosphate GlcNAc-1-phosphate transferase